MGHVQLFDVSLRDGLQNEATVVDTDTKLEVLERLVAAGYRDIEVTSFVRPRMVPQLADAAELIARLPAHDDVRYWALVPNQIGLERAIETGIQHICTFMSASETHNRKNVNRTIKESLVGLERVIGRAASQEMGVRAYISTVFGCPFEGDVSVQSTLDLGRALLDAGADVIVLGDTTGMGTPHQVVDVLEQLQAAGIPLDVIGLHFHDTRGTALVNAFAAYHAGARMFDGSTGGMGGCPYAPGATGNAATEDLVYLFDSIGVDTGVDLATAIQAGELLEQAIGHDLPGRYFRYTQASNARQGRSSASQTA